MKILKLALVAAVLSLSIAGPSDAASRRSKPTQWQTYHYTFPLILGIGY